MPRAANRLTPAQGAPAASRIDGRGGHVSGVDRQAGDGRRSVLRAAWPWVAILFAAFSLRVGFQHREVFAADRVVFQSTDPWYHVRLIEQFARHAPHISHYDPYAICPDGQAVLVAPLLDAVVVAIATLIARGRPDDALLHHVAAWIPPVLATLTVLLAGLLGGRLFGRRVGLATACLLAVMPGQFLRYSVLGYCDHHVLEALLSTTVFYAVIRALQGRRTVWSVVAGVALAAYLMTWVAGGFVVLMMTAWAAVDIARACWAGEERSPAAPVTIVAFAVAALTVWPFRQLGGWVSTHIAVLAAGSALVAVLAGGAALARRSTRPRLVFFASVGGIAIAGLFGLTLAQPAALGRFVQMASWSVVAARRALVEEATPLLMHGGAFSLRGPWETFGFSIIAALAGLVLLTRRITRRNQSAAMLLLAWPAGVLAATLLQERFGYYAAVGVAILAAFALEQFCRWLQRGDGVSPRAVTVGRGVYAVGLFAMLGSLAPYALQIAKLPSGPSPDWREALTWMRANTPPPFGAADHYHRDFTHEDGRNPDYGVMCTWDRGYWVTGLAHRPPNANPSQAQAADTSAYFVSESETEAELILGKLHSRYVILDCTVPVWAGPEGKLSIGKFTNLAAWAGRDSAHYFERVATSPDEGAPQILIFHPAYFRSMAVRLFVYGGQAYSPQLPSILLRLGALPSGDGRPRRYVASEKRFERYEAAEAFMAEHAGEAWELVSLNPGESCVPLEALQHCRRIHQSPTTVAQRGAERLGYVQVFEVTTAPRE
jgi:dolichyl-diphosphooligosaccharide--protein glycosyltransferase